MISQVPPETIDAVWPQLLPMVERGLRHGQGDETTSLHMREAIRRGDMLLWVMHEGEDIQAGVVLSIRQYPTGKKVFIELIAGHGRAVWSDQLETLLIDYRDLIGANCIEASCRPGVARILERRGWRRKSVIMEAPR